MIDHFYLILSLDEKTKRQLILFLIYLEHIKNNDLDLVIYDMRLSEFFLLHFLIEQVLLYHSTLDTA